MMCLAREAPRDEAVRSAFENSRIPRSAPKSLISRRLQLRPRLCTALGLLRSGLIPRPGR